MIDKKQLIKNLLIATTATLISVGLFVGFLLFAAHMWAIQ